MKVAIIGAGFTGLSAAHKLTKLGHKVVVFEKDSRPGGLAVGFKEKGWNWTLEEHYHHWFANDKTAFRLAKEINHKVIIKRPKTSTLIAGKISQLDSPFSLLRFPQLSFLSKLRMGLTLGFLRYNPFWKPFDKYKAEEILPKLMGNKSYNLIWHPLFLAKFQDYAKDVSLAWFWARIRKRTSSLAYPEGGFLSFANHIKKDAQLNGAVFNFDSEIINLASEKNIRLTIRKKKKIYNESFDKVIVTLPTSLFLKITKGLSKKYINKFKNLKSLGATNLFLRLNKPFLKDDTYWLNVCEENSPLMAVVEHTNFMDKKYYNGEYLVYIGHYVPRSHIYFRSEKDALLKRFDPYLKKLNKDYRKNLISAELFKAPFAQPVMPVNYLKKIPEIRTPLKNVYLANIDLVYPWDRGTNYAIELGEKVSEIIQDEQKAR